MDCAWGSPGDTELLGVRGYPNPEWRVVSKKILIRVSTRGSDIYGPREVRFVTKEVQFPIHNLSVVLPKQVERKGESSWICKLTQHCERDPNSRSI
jgi:hypothetical protein